MTAVIVVEGLLDDVTRQRMKQVLADLIERARGVAHARRRLRPRADALAQRNRACGGSRSRISVHPVFAEFMRSPRLLAVLSALLGPSGVRLHGSKLNLKSPEYGSPVEWHQDWAFYPHTNDDLLAVGVLLDDATRRTDRCWCCRAAIAVRRSIITAPTVYFCGAMDPSRDGLDFASARAAASHPRVRARFHHVRAVHGSAQNRSTQSRNLLLYEFAAADAFPLLGVPDWDDFNSTIAGRHAHRGAAHGGLSDSHALATGSEPGFDLRKPDGARAALLRPAGCIAPRALHDRTAR